MNLIDLQARDHAETEILTLSTEMVERADLGALSAHHFAKLARRVAETPETLTMKDARH